MDWAEGRWNLKRIACANVADLVLARQALHDVLHVRGLRANPLADVVPRICHGFSGRFGFSSSTGQPRTTVVLISKTGAMTTNVHLTYPATILMELTRMLVHSSTRLGLIAEHVVDVFKNQKSNINVSMIVELLQKCNCYEGSFHSPTDNNGTSVPLCYL
jgi:hypothetical protein